MDYKETILEWGGDLEGAYVVNRNCAFSGILSMSQQALAEYRLFFFGKVESACYGFLCENGATLNFIVIIKLGLHC